MEFGSAASSTCVHNKLNKTEDEEDIFSKLPEPLIGFILSFLSTKDAVRTSVLSKRWVNRWTFITSLELDDTGSNVHFVNFVNRILLLTQSSNMESFTLTTSYEYEASLLNSWISSILIRKVKNLELYISSELSFSPLTSHLLFSSQNYLEEMVFDTMEFASIKVPPCGFVYFSSLKLLNLCGTIFTFEYSLNLNLPNLKVFKTENCFWVSACPGSVSVTVDAPLLETIDICDYDRTEDENLYRSAINFTASQPKKISYSGTGDGVSRPIILPAPLSARDASANIFLYRFDQDSVLETESRAFMLLKQFCQVMSLCFYGLEVLTQPNVLPVFPMLCDLELSLLSCKVLLGFLQKSPLLKTLTLTEAISEFDQELLNSCLVPECLTSTLKNVTFKIFNECDLNECVVLCFAKFFLENGKVLEEISFSLDDTPLDEEFKEEFKENLLLHFADFDYVLQLEPTIKLVLHKN